MRHALHDAVRITGLILAGTCEVLGLPRAAVIGDRIVVASYRILPDEAIGLDTDEHPAYASNGDLDAMLDPPTVNGRQPNRVTQRDLDRGEELARRFGWR